MIFKDFEHNVILYLLIIIFIVNLQSIYNDESPFANYKKISFTFLIMSIIFVILIIMHIKKNKTKKLFYAKFFVESDDDNDDSYENFIVDNSNGSDDSDDSDDLKTDYEIDIFIEN
jgi:hypothetical protein